ncbi:MAG TPA: nucleotide exchange factor GrpE [Candidatus Binatia bacterium]|nr:nucleotide exchange factor GrpE [Candidatus Binatia bacterium]
MADRQHDGPNGSMSGGDAAGREGHGPQADAGERPEPALPQTLPEALARIEQLRAELAAATAEAKESQDRFLRERADVENFKRRLQREKSEALRYANEPLLREMLPVVDNLERTVRAAREAGSAGARRGPGGGASPIDALLKGAEMVLQQFSDVLGRFGVARVPAARATFDPAHHEALAHVESDQHEPGTVVDEHLPGYRLHERLLRPAQVTVAKAPALPRPGSTSDKRPA